MECGGMSWGHTDLFGRGIKYRASLHLILSSLSLFSHTYSTLLNQNMVKGTSGSGGMSVDGPFLYAISQYIKDSAEALSSDNTFREVDSLEKWVKLINRKTATACVTHRLTPSFTNASKLVGQVYGALTPGSLVVTKDLGGTSELNAMALVRNAGGKILENTSGGFRYSGTEFIGFANTFHFWPPPLYTADEVESSSDAWTVTIPKSWGASEFAEWLDKFPEESAAAVFRLFDKTGALTDTTLIRIRGTAPTDRVNQTWHGAECKWSPRCSLCWQGFPQVEPHLHTKCPLLVTMNKVRAREGVMPIKVKDGKLVFQDTPVAIDVGKEIKKLTDTVGKINLRVKTLEGKAKGEKRKGGEQKAGPLKKPKPTKKGGEPKGKGPKGKGGGKGDNGKGKGKATA
ncbi:hypothetical protein BDZ94DRAFT_1277272 [Collybia nuda]|uniref:Uncharacterized protein n=1 Tax=Collybia nuda TaxID=64659 RepID=A0A9P5XQN9_9AGAR|nr:hypothetical protein BDZ94DRAFT_1277272 [Collybia nuda]